MAVQWFEQAELNAVYAALAELLREGGLFLNADHLPPAEPRISELGEELTTAWQHANLANGEETHTDFHAAAAADPALRSRRGLALPRRCSAARASLNTVTTSSAFCQ